jgi:hypothetical protein
MASSRLPPGTVLPAENKALAKTQPKKFHSPSYLATKCWVALRLVVGKGALGRSETYDWVIMH